VLLRAGAAVELCHVIEKGKAPRKKLSAKKWASSSKRGRGRGKGKKVVDSDSEHEVVTGLENELEALSSRRKVDPGSNVEVNMDELPTFTIKTRLGSASIENLLHERMDTDDEQDELESSPNVARQIRGTKRKALHNPLPSPTPKLLPHSSHNLAPEVLIMIPSPKKKRLAESSCSPV
jgi:Fanconi-associated nuclease 1